MNKPRVQRQLRKIAIRFARESTYRIGDGWVRHLPVFVPDHKIHAKFHEYDRRLAVSLEENGQFCFTACLSVRREDLMPEHISLVLLDLWDAYCAAFGYADEEFSAAQFDSDIAEQDG